MSDVSDLRQAKVAAELLAADDRFNSCVPRNIGLEESLALKSEEFTE